MDGDSLMPLPDASNLIVRGHSTIGEESGSFKVPTVFPGIPLDPSWMVTPLRGLLVLKMSSRLFSLSSTSTLFNV